MLGTFGVGSERLECFYQHLFTSDGAAIHLLDELGLLRTISWQTTRMGLLYDGRVYPFTSPWDLMRFTPLLGIRDRIRLGLVALRLRRNQTGANLDDLTAVEWMRRNAGGRAVNVVWQPLLRAKFGEQADDVSMAWLWNRIRLRFASRTMLSRREMLGYQRGSFAVWIDAIVRLIGVLGGEIGTSERVTGLRRTAEGIEVDSEGGRTTLYDVVVATVSNEAFLRLVPGIERDYAIKLGTLAYRDGLSVVLGLKHRLSEYYWLNVNDGSSPFAGVIEHTNMIGPESYGGRNIVYLVSYLRSGSEELPFHPNNVPAIYTPYLRRINPAFDESWVTEQWVFRASGTQPIFTVGAGSQIPDHRTPMKGVYLANMSQAYPQERGQNTAITLGERIASMVDGDVAEANEMQLSS
jgi:protoporphyrinogen oxidase